MAQEYKEDVADRLHEVWTPPTLVENTDSEDEDDDDDEEAALPRVDEAKIVAATKDTAHFTKVPTRIEQLGVLGLTHKRPDSLGPSDWCPQTEEDVGTLFFVRCDEGDNRDHLWLCKLVDFEAGGGEMPASFTPQIIDPRVIEEEERQEQEERQERQEQDRKMSGRLVLKALREIGAIEGEDPPEAEAREMLSQHRREQQAEAAAERERDRCWEPVDGATLRDWNPVWMGRGQKHEEPAEPTIDLGSDGEGSDSDDMGDGGVSFERPLRPPPNLAVDGTSFFTNITNLSAWLLFDAAEGDRSAEHRQNVLAWVWRMSSGHGPAADCAKLFELFEMLRAHQHRMGVPLKQQSFLDDLQWFPLDSKSLRVALSAVFLC